MRYDGVVDLDVKAFYDTVPWDLRLGNWIAHCARKEIAQSLPLSIYSTPGGLRQDPGRAAEFAGRSQYLGQRE